MSPLELTISITTLANAIACSIKDDDTLNFLSIIITQLGADLSTIATHREFCEKLASNKKSSNTTTSE